jgi:hypothetical protein
MFTFFSILNKYYEGFMVLELDYSFLGYFHNSFSRSFLSPSFPCDSIYEFKPPNYMIGLIFLARVSMRRDIL